MRKTVIVIIVLIFCFFIGFSIPYLYENYGSFIEDYVSGNGNSQVETISENEDVVKEEKNNEPKEEKIDYSKYLAKAKDQFYNGNYKESIDIYIDLYDKGYDKLEVVKNIVAVSDYGDMDKERVFKLLERTYPEYEDSIEYNYYYGKFLYENGSLTKAEDILNNLSQLIDNQENIIGNRKTALAYYYLGNLNLNNDEQDKALEYFQKGIASNKEIILNYLAAASIYEKDNLYDKAIEMYQAALNQDHSLSRLYYNLALLFEEKGELIKAYHYWDRCVNSGIKADQARQRIKEIQTAYPEFFEEEEVKPTKREIKWFDIEEIEPNDKYREIKIGLQENIDRIRFQSKYDFMVKQGKNVLFTGENNTQYQINYRDHTFYILQNGKILEIISTNQDLQITSEKDNNLFAIYGIKFAQNYFWGGVENRQYRGDIYLNQISHQHIDLLNYIDLTSYLLSVVPSEMPASWPEEALKAQSVVARSYILKNLQRHSSEGYDLCASVHCIVYAGATNESPRTTQAVTATKNEIITHEGNVIDAVFSSNSGGYTEASENVWGNSFAYLKSVNTLNGNKYNFPLEPYQMENWFIEKPASYSYNKYTTQSSYRWVKEINLNDLKERHELEGIKKVYITNRTSTGTVQQIKIEGTNRTVTVNDNAIRRALTGLKSTKFIVKNIYDNNVLQKIIIFGAGWGHSVGMDQSAAAGMAVNGSDYKEIIDFFYPETKITNLQ